MVYTSRKMDFALAKHPVERYHFMVHIPVSKKKAMKHHPSPPCPCGLVLTISTLLVMLFTAVQVQAESAVTAEWNISADSITRLENPPRIIAEGNIVLVKRKKTSPPLASESQREFAEWATLLEEEYLVPAPTPEDILQPQEQEFEVQAVIKADRISYDMEKQTIEAEGNVSIESGGDRLVAQQGVVNLNKETGSFTDAVITREDFEMHFEGKSIEKTGVKTYRVEDGWVITCKIDEGKTPPWSFASAETTIEQEGYATLKHARFKVREVPIFYLPYMVVPVKTTRQTGFLFPEISNSDRDGLGLNLPFFINVSESTDLTLFPEYYSNRGVMPGAEFRYIIDAESKGRFMGSYLDDRLSDPSETEYYEETGFTHTNSDRYWIRGKVDQDLPFSMISRLDIDVVSDRDYLEEFNTGVTGFNQSQDSFLETFGRGFENRSDDERRNSLRLFRPWTTSFLNIDFLAINDVREEKTDPTPLWQLPSIEYTGAIPLQDSIFTLEWDGDYVNYWREEGVGGQRIDLFPRIGAPLPLGPYFESRAEVGGRGTFYYVETYGDAIWNQDDTPTRFLPVFETEVATTLQRNFSLASQSYDQLRHLVRPYIEYDYIPEEDQSDLPDFDAVDRIDESNAITYGFDNFFDLYAADGQYARQYGFLRVEQSYDLRSEASDDRWSPVNLKIGWNPLRKMSLVYTADIPIDGDDNTTHGFSGDYRNSRGDLFSLDYRYNEEEEIEQINGAFKLRLLPRVITALDIEHSLAESETNEANFAVTYLAQCWSVQLQATHTPTDERILLVFNLANIGTPIALGL